MKIKSARYFREKYMTDVRHVQFGTGYDPSFVGCSHMLPNGTYVKGFFDLYHGDKEKVGDFLSNFLKIAEDGQAIYEFLQNAADCNSTLFYMFYNEKYFLAVNNGNVFNQAGLRSLLNVAQSTKSTSSQIGRFGIGFKLVHRLVGKGDGMRELTQDYKGPIMFSWSKKSDLVNLMNHASIEPEDNIDDSSDLPYLLKLILTNFPAEPNETVKDLNFRDKVLFDDTEYDELCKHVNNSLSQYLDVDNLNQGSLFFIRLGEGKKELLDKDYEQNLKIGVEYSLNTLKGLENVKINGTQIEKVPLKIESGIIAKDSETFNRIDPEYKDDDIHFSIGYNEIDFTEEEPFKKVEALKKSPTFYKYFPLGDEIHQSAIFIHCDSLSNEANRRKMHEDSINKELIPEIARFIVNLLTSDRSHNNVSRFCQLYANVLLSNAPHDNSDWLKEVYYDIIQDYLITSIPTQNGFGNDSNDVKIKRIKTNIPLSVVNDNYQWFKWNNENLDSLLIAAKDKLGIKTFDIVDLIIEADISKLNAWIASVDDATYKSFLNEINTTTRNLYSNTKFKEKIRNVKLFKFSDNCFYAYDELVMQKYGNYVFTREKTIYTTNKTEDINNELISLGFVISDINIDTYDKIKECFVLPKDKRIFELLESSVKDINLPIAGKRKLINHLTTQNAEKKLTDVGDESIRSLYLCHNHSGELMPLCDLIGRKYRIPSWLTDYQIKSEDYFSELDKFLMPEKYVYSNIIYKYWDNILVYKDVEDFYKETKRLYDQNADYNKTLKGKKYIYTENDEFVALDDVIYNSKMLNESLNYKSLNNVITTIYEGKLPKKEVTAILSEEPFGLNNVNICNYIPTGENGVDFNDIQNILKFCALNYETFFKEFVIERKNDGEYHINTRTDSYYQVYVKDRRLKSYIEKNYYDTMILLPNGLEEYKDSEGIVSGANLHASILAEVEDIDNEKENLIDIVKYGARRDFIVSLSEIRIDLDEATTPESFSYKLLYMATSVLENNDDIQNFRNKLIIEKDGESFCHDQIPQTIAESFEIEEAKRKFDIAQILPNENGNGSLLIEMAEKYSELGIQRVELNELLGISEETDIDSLYETLIANYDTLLNEQQLAFVLTVCANKNESVPSFNLITINNEAYEGDFVVKNYEFISDQYTLAKSYSHLKDFIDLPYGNNTYIHSPYIDEEGEFICPGLDTKDSDDYDFKKVIALLEYLEKLYKKSKEKFKSVDWSSIKDNLAFDPNICVYPSKYALEEEKLPHKVESWVKKSSEHQETIGALGVLMKDSVVMKFRRFLIGDLVKFDCHTLYSVKSKKDLENSLEWASDKTIFPLSDDKYNVVKIAIEQINKLRKSSGIVITDEYDIDNIDDDSIEYAGEGYKEWKEDTGYSIYLYDGALPHVVEIDEYIDGPIFSYCEGDITDDGDAIIYINKEADMQEAMHHLADSNNINLSREEVYKLFNRSIIDLQNQIKQLEEDNRKLREGLPVTKGGVNMESEESTDVDEAERPEWNEIARKKVKKKLESEGYKFTQGIGSYSDVPGVIDPDDYPVHLVVKSCRWGKLYITPTEWGTLLKPKAMLWIYDGNTVIPLHLRALIRNQDQLVLKMDTRNLDDVSRVSNFAQILRYFKQVHFNFNSVRPTTIASTYKEYAFDDRPMDEKPDEDEFE